MNQPPSWQFGTFILLPTQRLLLDGDAPVRLGGRALDLLIVLVQAAGKIVSRDELIASVWKKVVVDEVSLRVHVAALRRALNDDGQSRRYIVNVPGRGYSFVGQILPRRNDEVVETLSRPYDKGSSLPPLLVNVVGRKDAINEVGDMASKHRLVTVVGAGGVGKTTVAIAAAAQLAANYRDGVRFVDLAPLSDARQVANAWAHAVDPSRPVLHEYELGELLAERHMLVVLDNCEHVVQAAATAAEAVLAAAPGVHVLATSREAMRAVGESVIRLASLELPPIAERLTAEQAKAFAAVQLFTQRATANFAEFSFSDEDVPHVTEICWRLDGIPLAIELAAGRVSQMGLHGLSARLEDRFSVLTKGRRTALPRQQTLRAAIDWSYEQLSEAQRAVLRRLSIFAGAFSFDSAVAVCEEDLPFDASDAIDELALKSLITVDTRTDIAKYRLLESTRAYALEKLKEEGEFSVACRIHALHVCNVFERLESGSPLDPAIADASHTRWIDDIQLAVQMSFSMLRDPSLSVRLLSATASVWFQRSLLDEYRERAELALKNAGDLAEQPKEALMRLWNLLGLCYWHIKGTGPEPVQAFERTYELARRLQNVHFERMALWGLCAQSCSSGDYAAALRHARQHVALTPPDTDPQAEIQSGNVMQVSLHFMGQLTASRNEAMATKNLIRGINQTGTSGQFQLDPYSVINAFLSHSLWIQGFPSQALEVGAQAVQSARSTQHALSLCFALFGHCAVLLWCGRWAELRHQADELMAVATDRRLGFWKAWAQTYQDALTYGTVGKIVPHVRGSLRVPHQFEMLATVSDEFLDAEILVRAEAGHCPWCAPELLRAQGDRLLRQGSAPQEAEQWFSRALDMARASGALSWELRAATSLAQSWSSQDRRSEATALLTDVLERFTEGFDTSDLQRAKQVLSGGDISARHLGAVSPSLREA